MSDEVRNTRRNGVDGNEALVLRDDRIDWERRQKGKRRPDDVVSQLDEDTGTQVLVDEVAQAGKKRRDARKKRRHLVLDEETGRMVVKRRRRPHRDAPEFDEYEAYDEHWM